MTFISTGLLLRSMPKPWQRCPLPIIHSLPIPERGRAGWLPSTLAQGLEETMCWDTKRWKRGWGREAPNRCIPWGDNGAKSYFATEHMQDLRREAWAGVCLPRMHWGSGRGSPSKSQSWSCSSKNTQRSNPSHITCKTTLSPTLSPLSPPPGPHAVCASVPLTSSEKMHFSALFRVSGHCYKEHLPVFNVPPKSLPCNLRRKGVCQAAFTAFEKVKCV